MVWKKNKAEVAVHQNCSHLLIQTAFHSSPIAPYNIIAYCQIAKLVQKLCLIKHNTWMFWSVNLD